MTRRGRDRGFELGRFFKNSRIGKYLSRLIDGSDIRVEETDLRCLASIKKEFLTGDFMLGTFLHALWCDAESLCDWTTPRNGHAAGFHADVVRSSCAGLDAESLAGATKAGINGGPDCDSVIGLRTCQLPRRLPRPEAENLEDAFFERSGIENTSIKKNGIRNQNAIGCSGRQIPVRLRTGQKASEVFRDRGISCIGKP